MGKYSYSDARKQAQESDQYESTAIKLPEGVKRFKVEKEGVYRLDFIPFVAKKGNPFSDAGALHYERTYYVHPRIGVNENSYLCLAENFGQPCPVCEYQRKLKGQDDVDEKLIKDLYPKRRQLFQVIDVDSKEQDIQIWDFSYHNFGKQLLARIRNQDERDEYHLFYDLDRGYTLRVGFKEETMGKRSFFKAESIDFKGRDSYKESIIDKGYCLDDLLIAPTYDELKSIFLQESGGGGEKDKDRGGRSDDRRERSDSPRGGDNRRSSSRDDDRGGRSEERSREEPRGGRDEPRGGDKDKDKDRGGREERSPRDEPRGESRREERTRDDDRRGGRSEDRSPREEKKDNNWDDDRAPLPDKEKEKEKDKSRDEPRGGRSESRGSARDEDRRGSSRDEPRGGDKDKDKDKDRDAPRSGGSRKDDWE